MGVLLSGAFLRRFGVDSREEQELLVNDLVLQGESPHSATRTAVVLIPQKSLVVDDVDQTLASYHQNQASAKQQHRNLWFGAMPRDYFEVTETGENDGEICHSRDQL